MTLLTQIQIRRDTASNWVTANPVLALGELGLETDTGHLRVGDGATAWTTLSTAFKQMNVRTPTQLAAAPTSADLALGAGALFTSSDNILRYINGAGTAFVAIDVVAMQNATATAQAAATAAVSTASSAQTAASAAQTSASAAQTAATAAQTAAAAAVPLTQKGAANGVATLDSGTHLPAAQLPNPTSGALGGVRSAVPVTHQFVTGINTSGVPTTAQPAVADLSDAGTIGLLLGVYGTTSALQAAYPAASNAGQGALVGSSAPFGVYRSDGTTWNKEVSPTDLNAKQSVPVVWNGTTPALVSSTNPVPSFGSNAFLYTGAGGAILDGLTYQTGDVALWNGSVFVKEVYGGGYLGAFATTSALQTANPAASNPACIALVVGVIYISDGTAWQKRVGASTDLTDGTTLNAAIVTNTSAAVQVTGNVTITTGNQATYNGKILEFTGAYSVTLSAGLVNDFGFAGIPPASGNASIVSDSTTTLNGATTTLTRAYATQAMFTVTQRNTNHNQYVVV